MYPESAPSDELTYSESLLLCTSLLSILCVVGYQLTQLAL
jgi:hypothetical protein